MSNLMTYNGYSAPVQFDADDEIFFGRIAGIRDGVSFHGNSVAELKAAFHEAVEVAPEVHRKAALAAEISGKSLNQWAEEALEHAAAGVS